MSTNWKQVWAARRVDKTIDSILARLLAADGFDMPFAKFSDEAWLSHVSAVAGTIGIKPGCSVFDVGCGAGAFLFDLHRKGCAVGGLDASPALIQLATDTIPEGSWIQADALDLDVSPRYDFVAASASFHYFPTLEYSAAVIERMVQKARRGVVILDLPDLALRDEAIALRMRLAGGEAYSRKYDDLPHLYFDRTWVRETLMNAGASRVEFMNQQIEGYPNAAHRYNVFAWLDYKREIDGL